MELLYLSSADLKVSAANMRDEKKPPKVDDLVASISALGVLQPLLVRRNGEGYDIIAGRRRYHAIKEIEKNQGTAIKIPCNLLDIGNDAAALEASLAENIVRAGVSEMEEFRTFQRMFMEGLGVDEIAIAFNISTKDVKQRMALGNLLPALQDKYDNEEIGPDVAQALTMASHAQQQKWLDLNKKGKAPWSQHMIRDWLAGGEPILESAAIFDKALYNDGFLVDLFSDDRIFMNTELFWTLQNAAIEEKVKEYQSRKWANVVVKRPEDKFNIWTMKKTSKKDGGTVFIQVDESGKVTYHEGFLPMKAAKKEAEGEEKKTEAPELTSPQQRYVDAYMRAVARYDLVDSLENRIEGMPARGLVSLVAMCLAGTVNVSFRPDHIEEKELTESIEAQKIHKPYGEARDKVFALLKMEKGNGEVTGRVHTFEEAHTMLRSLSFKDLETVATVLAGEVLGLRGEETNYLRSLTPFSLEYNWVPDKLFYDQLRNKKVIQKMLEEVAGKRTAKDASKDTGKKMKETMQKFLTTRVSWLPRWLRKKPSLYLK